MKRWFWMTCLCMLTQSISANTDLKITEKSKTLKSTLEAEKQLHGKLQDIASDIIEEEKNIEKVKEKIESLSKNIDASQESVTRKQEYLERLVKDTQVLSLKKKDLEHKLIKIIAEDFSFYLISDGEYSDNEEGVLVDEVLQKMDIIMRKELGQLGNEYKQINDQILSQSTEIKTIHTDIQSAKNKKDELIVLEKKKESSIVALNRKKEEYKRQLDTIAKEREEIRATLEKLQIIKVQEESKRLAEQNAKKQKTPEAGVAGKSNIRQIGSSYQNSNVKKYVGEKTIAPLEAYSVKRRFGDYIDPIYNIKIFNESVVLSSRTPDAVVKSVLSGKVVFAKDTASMQKVVIIENSDEIHTIYAHLSKIAPTIEVGQKIKKGYVIGRVDNDLTFEVTQKNFHIDPLEMIAK
ncbi:murein hydrolase activator EnvC family protein [Sulfurospirillum barnesii]|uniref:Membrane-bound metallopeptidase n=1 Tax=Sulfurospirillum barnesii (strain ATCC 700032 / DSM 10660 / SES-3) TaxID=760154 RepID=I3XVN0_SULBS|nr:peptidoglycan DD-metalloendopeptidase family protein [Sulfurospirillum barnesii]AFL68004.1 membrane-bound metallopeptidase [Sulfurospirillum barnesii SES-3]